MANFSLPNKDEFGEKRKQFLESRQRQRLEQKYKPKTYQEKKRKLYYLAICGSYFAQCFSVITGFTWLYFFVKSFTQNLSMPEISASIISVLILVGIEFWQRDKYTETLEDGFVYGFRRNQEWNMVVVLLICGLGVSLSYAGSYLLPEFSKTPPSYVAPTLINIDSIKVKYELLAADNDQKAEKYINSAYYKGRLSGSDRKVYNKMISDSKAYRDAGIEKSNLAEIENDGLLIKAKNDYDSAVLGFNNKNKEQGVNLAFFSIAFQLIFLLTVWYKEKYEYLSAVQFSSMDENDNLEVKTVIIEKEEKAQNRNIPGQRSAYKNNQIGFFHNKDSQQNNALPESKKNVAIEAKKMLPATTGNVGIPQQKNVLIENKKEVKTKTNNSKSKNTSKKNASVGSKPTEKKSKSQEQQKNRVAKNIEFSMSKSKKGSYQSGNKIVIQHVSRKHGKKNEVLIKEFERSRVVSLIGSHNKRRKAARKAKKQSVEQNNANWVAYWQTRIKEF